MIASQDMRNFLDGMYSKSISIKGFTGNVVQWINNAQLEGKPSLRDALVKGEIDLIQDLLKTDGLSFLNGDNIKI